MQRPVSPSRRSPVSLKSHPLHTCTQAARAAGSHLSTQVSGHFLFLTHTLHMLVVFMLFQV